MKCFVLDHLQPKLRGARKFPAYLIKGEVGKKDVPGGFFSKTESSSQFVYLKVKDRQNDSTVSVICN